MEKKCIVHLYTGDGSGKSTSSLGVSMRSLGHGHKVLVIQFMTGRKDIGEYRIMERLAPVYEIHQFGREEFVNLDDPSEEDRIIAQKGIEFIRSRIDNDEIPQLLILDEVNLAVAIGLLKIDEVRDIISSLPEDVHVYMTGRCAPVEFIEFADFVTEIKNIKQPADMEYVEGIEY